MKRTLSLLLAILLLLVTFVSCTKNDPGTDDSSVGEESTEVSDDPIVSDTRYETIVSIGKNYTVSFEAASQYEDTFGTELCDGVYADPGASYSDVKFAGFSISGKTLDVVFDMEEDSKRIYKFGISYLATTQAGIGGLGTCRVYYSNDGDKWTRAPFFLVPAFEEGTVQQAWATLEEPVDAKYVRFSLRGTSSWLFLDELVIVADTASSSLHANYLTQLEAAYNGNHLSQSDVKAGSDSISGETLVSATIGRSYTTSYKPGKTFPDSANLLTNGVETGAAYESGEFVGYEGGGELTIDVKLSGTVEGLCSFSLAMYQQANLRHMLPYYVDFYVSADGTNFDRIGRVYAPDDTSVTNFTYSLRLKKGFSAKAVRFVLAETDSTCFLIEEADASYYGEDQSNPLYPALSLPDVTEELYWPNASSKVTNLVAGLPYQIVSGTDLSYAEESPHNTLADAGVLTDGQYSPNLVYNNGYWNRTRNGGRRSVYFDLGYNSSITGFKINYLQYSDYAITAPGSTNLYLSVDGVNWYSAGIANCTAATKAESVAAELTLDTPYEARFICVSFPCTPHSYADEIEVYGSQAITGSTVKLSDAGLQATAANHFMAPSEDILGGVEDMVLIYYGSTTLNEEFFLPYVAYLDADGKIKDTLFDGFLFLPTVSGIGLPSGGKPHESSDDSPTLWIDWLYQFDEDFKEGQHFDALNKTVAKVKEALSLPSDFKVKVYPSIMYPNLTATDFGDVDGDGVSEDLSKPENRIKVLDLYMQMYLDRFAEENYDNITLDGFYWFAEAINHQDMDIQTLPVAAEIAAAKGTQIFWIPYYMASGYATWSTYGFVAAYMQPNYVFNLTRPVSQLYKATEHIKSLGMGLEIEVNDEAVSQLAYYKRYMRYLGYGIEAGYMDGCIHAYYQSVSVFSKACYSDTEMGRSLYDATYGFIKGTLVAPEKIADFSVSCEAGQMVSGNLLEGLSGINTAELTVSAEHGSVTIDSSGNYWYIPYEGFTGTDTFSFHYSNYLMWAADTTVTVTVG